jgi:signal peptidase
VAWSWEAREGVPRPVSALLAWALLAVAVSALVTDLVVPRVFGATPYAVLTSSMEPGLSAGTLVVVRPVRPESIGNGTVITYQLQSGEPQVVTHRVVAQAVDGEGTRSFQTRGDANEVADRAWVRPVQVRGEVWYAVPHLGRLHAALTGQEHQRLVWAAAAALLAYAAVMFVGSVRERHTKPVVEQGSSWRHGLAGPRSPRVGGEHD